MNMQGTPLELLGVPYVEGGASPREGFDCWNLVAYVRERYFGLFTPFIEREPYTRGAMRAIDAEIARGHWNRVALPGRAGDVVGMAFSSRARLHHVGVALEGGVLQTWTGFSADAVGSVILMPWTRARECIAVLEVYAWRS